jgi:hypothetical protein
MNCPFCGVVSDVPHETQDACIEALNAEIGRVRTLLQHTTSYKPGEPSASSEAPDRDTRTPRS